MILLSRKRVRKRRCGDFFKEHIQDSLCEWRTFLFDGSRSLEENFYRIVVPQMMEHHDQSEEKEGQRYALPFWD